MHDFIKITFNNSVARFIIKIKRKMFPDKSEFNSRVKLQERNIKRNHPKFYNELKTHPDKYPGKTIQEQMYIFFNHMDGPYK